MSKFYTNAIDIITDAGSCNTESLFRHLLDVCYDKINNLDYIDSTTVNLVADLNKVVLHFKSELTTQELKKGIPSTNRQNNQTALLVDAISSSGLEKIEKRMFEIIILELRATILDLIDYDKLDVKNLFKVDKWIVNVVYHLKKIFKIRTKSVDELVLRFNRMLFEEFLVIFTSQNEKIGEEGNQLILDFYFYNKKMELEDSSFLEFISRFKEGMKENICKEDEYFERIILKL